MSLAPHMPIQMILPFEYFLAVGAEILARTVFGSMVSLDVFWISERRGADMALVPARLLGVVGYLVVAVYIVSASSTRSQTVRRTVLT